MVETHRSTATAASKQSSPPPSSSVAPLPRIGNDFSSSRFDLWFNRYEAGGGRAREERRFVRGCVSGQERWRFFFVFSARVCWWDGLGTELLGSDALLQIKEEIAGGHCGGVNLPGILDVILKSTASSQWILLGSACALTLV
uniref:Uncharacterized protein n=1 Tax=Oryza glaberrima TaxID=4538 RepID=I1R3B7_ORYGL